MTEGAVGEAMEEAIQALQDRADAQEVEKRVIKKHATHNEETNERIKKVVRFVCRLRRNR